MDWFLNLYHERIKASEFEKFQHMANRCKRTHKPEENFINGDNKLYGLLMMFSLFRGPDITLSAKYLNYDLKKITKWKFQSKMIFHLDPNKQALEVILSRKLSELNHPSLNLNDMVAIQSKTHKHLGIISIPIWIFKNILKTNLVRSAWQLDY